MIRQRWIAIVAGACVAVGTADSAPPEVTANTAPPPSANTISGIRVTPSVDGLWQVDFDYTFTGAPPSATFRVNLTLKVVAPDGTPLEFHGPPLANRPEVGAHHVATIVDYLAPGTSTQFIVNLESARTDGQVLVSERIDGLAIWPTSQERLFYGARNMVSNGSSIAIQQARGMLEGILEKDPKFAPAFVELARVAMKQNWGPEGIHTAETLLDSALKLRPDDVDAKILLGYVYAHQHRLKDAETLFVDAAKSDPPNVWLWTNWGELLEMRNDLPGAIGKYRMAVQRPGNGYWYGARVNAYIRLFELLKSPADNDEIEALYKQRMTDFGQGSCITTDYARFKLFVRDDPQGAIELARGPSRQNCDDASARQIIGLASYMQWSRAAGDDGADALNQARIYLPSGPMALFLLAGDERSMVAARKLIAAGESIDQKDNERMTALGYALEKSELKTARRLLTLGARPDMPVGIEAMPAALIPVTLGNVAAVRMLQQAGVDFAKLRYRGATAIDYAKQTGNETLLLALTRGERSL